MVTSIGETAIPEKGTLTIGEIVTFDPHGGEDVKITSLFKDEMLDRVIAVRYSQIMLRLSGEDVAEYELHDFAEEKRSLESKQAVSAA